MRGRACARVRPADGERMLVDTIAVHVMHVAIVEVVLVPVVGDFLVPAARDNNRRNEGNVKLAGSART